jgi:hypothetical protein
LVAVFSVAADLGISRIFDIAALMAAISPGCGSSLDWYASLVALGRMAMCAAASVGDAVEDDVMVGAVIWFTVHGYREVAG